MNLPRRIVWGMVVACVASGSVCLLACNRSSIADTPNPIGEETQDARESASYESGVFENDGSPASEEPDEWTELETADRAASSVAMEDLRSIPGTAPELSEAAAQELARGVFDSVERGDKTAFLQTVTCFDAESIWGKVTRVKGKWHVDAAPTDPQTIEVDTKFSAPETTGTFEKTYTWRLVWDEGWKIVDWMR